MIGPILRRALAGRLPSRREVLLMLNAKEGEQQALLDTANRLRCQQKGEEVLLRGRVTARGSKALAQARTAARLGCSSVVICPEESVPADEVADLIRAIKGQLGLQVAVCHGDRPYEEYAAWRKAGADEYVLPHECSNPSIFLRIHGRPAAEMAARYLWLSGLGYRIAGGITVGLEGQTAEMLADDIEILRNADARAVRIRPLDHGAEAQALTVLAIVRLCLPDADIWMATDQPALHAQAIACGANLVVTALPGAEPDLESIPIAMAPGAAGTKIPISTQAVDTSTGRC